MDKKDSWKLVKALHAYKLHVPLFLVDLIAVQEILRLYAEGLSNDSIVESLNLYYDYVDEVLGEFYTTKFYRSRLEDLNFNPYKYYNEAGKDLDEFIVNTFLFIEDEVELTRLFFICTIYNRYKEMLDNYERS